MPKPETAMPLLHRLGGLFSLGFILVIVVSMGVSGWFALHEGLFRFTLPFTTADATQQVTQAVEAVRADPHPGKLRHVSQEMWALSTLTSVERFADSRLMEHGIYYTAMPTTNQALMLVHVLFGVFCMLLGGLQFWPGFRKRYLKAHRVIGMIYVVTVPVSVVTVLAYMALTPPHHIYAHLVAWVALWIFGLLALVAIAMALRALKARRIFEHQAWMALSFGCLLVAPLLRLDWVLLAWRFPGIDQETLNLVTMGMMLPEALLIAYGLILVNRQYARPMRQRPAATVAGHGARLFQRAQPALQATALALLVSNVLFYVAGTGMASTETAARLVPAALVEREQAVLAAHPGITLLFALGISLAFPAVVLALRQLLQPATAPALAASLVAPLLALGGGVASCVLGWHIGLGPDNVWLSGGTMYMVNGLVLAAFSLLCLGARHVGQRALLKEGLVFLLCLLPFPTLFFLTLQVLGWISLPADYIAAGQGFVLPVGFSAGLLFLAMLYVVHGQATREHN
jgi:hypothetical protein